MLSTTEDPSVEPPQMVIPLDLIPSIAVNLDAKTAVTFALASKPFYQVIKANHPLFKFQREVAKVLPKGAHFLATTPWARAKEMTLEQQLREWMGRHKGLQDILLLIGDLQLFKEAVPHVLDAVKISIAKKCMAQSRFSHNRNYGCSQSFFSERTYEVTLARGPHKGAKFQLSFDVSGSRRGPAGATSSINIKFPVHSAGSNNNDIFSLVEEEDMSMANPALQLRLADWWMTSSYSGSKSAHLNRTWASKTMLLSRFHWGGNWEWREPCSDALKTLLQNVLPQDAIDIPNQEELWTDSMVAYILYCLCKVPSSKKDGTEKRSEVDCSTSEGITFWKGMPGVQNMSFGLGIDYEPDSELKPLVLDLVHSFVDSTFNESPMDKFRSFWLRVCVDENLNLVNLDKFEQEEAQSKDEQEKDLSD